MQIAWRLWMLARRSVSDFLEVGGTRLAAAIAYYALLSLFPLVVALVAGAALIVPEGAAREEVIDQVVGSLPLTGEADARVREALEGAAEGAGAVGVVGFVGMLWTASGMMGAIRYGLTQVSGPEAPRPFVRGKAIDLAMVLMTGLLVLGATILTVTTRVAEELVLEPLGLPGGASALPGLLVPIVLAFLTLALLLRLVPADRIPWAGIWRGALGGALGLWVLATGFGFYVQNFARYNVLYGSLGVVIALLVFVFLAAILLLVAAAAAARWPAVAETRRPRRRTQDARPLRERLRDVLRRQTR